MSFASFFYCPTGTDLKCIVALGDVKLSASSAPVHPFKFNHCIIQSIGDEEREESGSAGASRTREGRNRWITESWCRQNIRARVNRQTGSIVCSRKHACQYTLIITYRGEHPNTRIFADRGEEAEIRICCEHRCNASSILVCVRPCIHGCIRWRETMIVSDTRRG